MLSSVNKRCSNIELLRILAMFLVLVLHALFLSIGTPNKAQCIATPGNAFLRLFFQSLAIVAVNVFVLISGWFGIKPTVKKLLSLLFQVFFFTITILIVYGFIHGFSNITPRSLLKSLMITKCYWFVKSYICLFIISPVLNLFVEKAEKSTFSLVLILFFTFQIIYGWTDSAPEFNYGYSALSFAGLYLLARYLRIYPIQIMSNMIICIIAYFVLSLILALGIWILIKYDFHTNHSVPVAFSYINPFVVLSSLSLFFFFINIEIPSSKVINWISTSVFSVYIIHINGFLFPFFRESVWYLYSNFPIVIRGLLILIFLVFVFMMCVLLDKVRLFVWILVDNVCSKDSYNNQW